MRHIGVSANDKKLAGTCDRNWQIRPRGRYTNKLRPDTRDLPTEIRTLYSWEAAVVEELVGTDGAA